MPKARKKKKEDKDDAEWTQGPSKPKAGSRNKKSCVIHCTNSSGDLVRLQSIESWKVVLRAATIREHDAILKISASSKEDEIPDITYHRNCRDVFTHKKDLQRIEKKKMVG